MSVLIYMYIEAAILCKKYNMSTRSCQYIMLNVFQPENVLQAILCLINELDLDALEVVDDAIRNRLDFPS